VNPEQVGVSYRSPATGPAKYPLRNMRVSPSGARAPDGKQVTVSCEHLYSPGACEGSALRHEQNDPNQ
jgi:hypothetical protein